VRKGWAQLSDTYRKRLERNGITQQQYEAGQSLGSARGHKHPPGISEKVWAELVRLAKSLNWTDRNKRGPKVNPETILRSELQKGTDPKWLAERMRERAANTAAYQRGDKGPGRARWLQRRTYAAPELYWYH